MGFKDYLNKPTPDVAQLAKKHGVSEAYIRKQLDDGIEVELEHTNSRRIAREIALDHLAESPKYYIELKKMENRL